jgi:predicted transcriptional regulator
MKEPKQKLIITKKPKGEDGHKTFSIRIKDETVARLDDIATKTNRSRNDLINMLLDYAMDYCEIHDDNTKK